MVKISEETNEISKFVQNRKKSITDGRIKNILWYVIECYNILSKKGETYSKENVKQNTKIPFEEYLRNRFVQDYLVQNKKLLEQKISALDHINFICEAQKEYIDPQDNKQKIDKIDIYINMLGLCDFWKEPDENIYFAIECKRIEKLSDSAEYIKDIEKFVNRKYINRRLPFEGQIAFIENSSITHTQLYEEINKKLDEKKTIITSNPLGQVSIHSKFNGAYLSKHKRNTDKREQFSIYHLLFDYSNIVID